jgi:cephalosporin-C deacetylase
MNLDLTRSAWVGVLAAWVITAVTAAFPAAAEQASTNYALTVSAERPDALYHKGEVVAFKIRLLLDQQPINDAEVQWTVSKDGMPPTRTGKLRLTENGGTVPAKLDEPGFLQCRVTFLTPAKNTLHEVAGAGIDPLQIRPSLPVPGDFDEFWTAQKERLAAVPIEAKLTPVKSPQREVECFDLQANCVGAPVSGYFARPTVAKTRSLPIILTVHGAGVRSSSLSGAAGWAKEGFLALDINAHGIPNGKPDRFYAELADSELKDYRAQGRESRDTVYFLGMFLRLVRAIDFLAAQPEWDGRTLIVSGSSQGGAQSIVAAGLDSRATFFAAGVPAMCDHTGAVVGRISGWPKLVPTDADAKPDPKVLEAARYYDAMNFATRARAAGIVTVGFIDTTCPPTSVYAAYNALRGKKDIFNDPPSVHRVSPGAGEAMRNAILRHVEMMKKGK